MQQLEFKEKLKRKFDDFDQIMLSAKNENSDIFKNFNGYKINKMNKH
jgi:hypothetical protein